MSLRRRELLSAVLGFVVCFLGVAAGAFFWSSGVEDRIAERIGVGQGRAIGEQPDLALPRRPGPTSPTPIETTEPPDAPPDSGADPKSPPGPGGSAAPAPVEGGKYSPSVPAPAAPHPEPTATAPAPTATTPTASPTAPPPSATPSAPAPEPGRIPDAVDAAGTTVDHTLEGVVTTVCTLTPRLCAR